MTQDQRVENFLCDMDGVLINDGSIVEGADQFLERLRATRRGFLVLTNNSLFTPSELRVQLSAMGLEVDENQLWTSALATAQFVNTQRPRGTAFVIGEESVHRALFDLGYGESSSSPDYVVLGETWEYSYDDFARAIQLIDRGSHFVSTNPEPTGPSRQGTLPGTGAMAAVIEAATGVAPYVVGKPNSMMIREGMDVLGASTHSTVMIGDRMETDVLAGVDAGLRTILVLSGANGVQDATRFPYRPTRVVDSVANLIDEL